MSQAKDTQRDEQGYEAEGAPNAGSRGAARGESELRLRPPSPAAAALDELVAVSLATVLQACLVAEAGEYVAKHESERDALGRALVARNGLTRRRSVPFGPATILVRAPRVNDRRVIDGVRQKYTSKILPPSRAPLVPGAYKLAAALLYDWASSDFANTRGLLERSHLPGAEEAVRLLTRRRAALDRQSLADVRFAHVIADSMPHFVPDLGVDMVQLLSLVGVLPDGQSQLLDLRCGDPSSSDIETMITRARKRGMSGPLLLGPGLSSATVAVLPPETERP